MPTDQLLHPFDGDADMDRALRDLLPPMPRSTAWEAHQRDALLTFIETGSGVPHRPMRSASDSSVLRLSHGEPASRRPRAAVFVGIAAAVVLLAVGLLTAPRWRGQEIPAASAPPATAGLSSVPPGLPTAFPAIDAAVLDGRSSAAYLPDDRTARGHVSQAVVARRTGLEMVDALVIEVREHEVTCESVGCVDEQALVVANRVLSVFDVSLFRDQPRFMVVIPGGEGEPVTTVLGVEPVAFVRSVGGAPVRSTAIRADGSIEFEIGDLPDGYEVVASPMPMPLTGMRGVLVIDRAADGRRLAVTVGTLGELAEVAPYRAIEPVDVSGRTGWTYDAGDGSPVIWQVDETTWASVTGARSQAEALSIARSVAFVDRLEWERRYGISLGDRNDVTELPATPIGIAEGDVRGLPPSITAPQLIGLEEVGAIPTDVPIGCGSTPPTDETIRIPVVAVTPQEALSAFIETVEPGLWPNGWIHTWNGEDDDQQHRFDYRRDDGQLVTVVYVDAVDGGWAVTRWLSTPC